MSLGFTDFSTEKFVIKMLSGLFDGNTDIVENILHMLDLPHPALVRRAALPRNWVERSQARKFSISCNGVCIAVYLYGNAFQPYLGPGF